MVQLETSVLVFDALHKVAVGEVAVRLAELALLEHPHPELHLAHVRLGDRRVEAHGRLVLYKEPLAGAGLADAVWRVAEMLHVGVQQHLVLVDALSQLLLECCVDQRLEAVASGHVEIGRDGLVEHHICNLTQWLTVLVLSGDGPDA